MRQRNRNRNQRSQQKPYFSKPLTKKRAKKQVKLVSRLATRPERRAIQGEIRASKLQDDRIDDYFAQYGEKLKEIAGSTGSKITGEAGATQATYMTEKQRVAAREQVEQHLQEAARRNSLRQDKRSLARETGDIRRDEFARLRDAERDYRLGLKAAREPGKERLFSAQEAAKTRKHTAREESKSRQFTATESRKDRRTTRKENRAARRFDRRHPSASSSSSSSDIDRADVQRAGNLLRTTPPDKFIGRTTQQIIDQIMLADQTISRREAMIAWRKYRRGSSDPSINPSASGPPLVVKPPKRPR